MESFGSFPSLVGITLVLNGLNSSGVKYYGTKFEHVSSFTSQEKGEATVIRVAAKVLLDSYYRKMLKVI